MILLIGLGNPDKKYENTRHNAGFMLLEKIQKTWNFPDFEFNKKFNSQISLSPSPFGRGCRVLATGEGEGAKDNKILLIKPQTFMNLSGTAVKAILDFYKLSPDDIIVIHDDIDIPLGKYKIATDSSSAGHNGVQNIIDQLGTQKFRRIRIGIGEQKEGALVCRLGVHDFVLEKFTPEELEAIEKISEDILREIEKII